MTALTATAAELFNHVTADKAPIYRIAAGGEAVEASLAPAMLSLEFSVHEERVAEVLLADLGIIQSSHINQVNTGWLPSR